MKAAQARVLLTGASGGIGRAVADSLLQAGASLLLVGRSPAKLAAQVHELGQRHGVEPARLRWVATDLAQAERLRPLAEVAADWGCNVLVHGAGAPSFGRLETLEPAAIRQLLDLNLLAPMLLSQALLPHLRCQRRAQIICIGSALGGLGLPGFSAYSASKFGLRGFAEALRRELGDSRVRVQYLGPRSTRTEFNNAGVQAYNRATGTAMDAPERVAHALLRLLQSEGAERFIGFPESLAVRLNGLAGPVLDGAFTKHRRSLPPLQPSADGAPATLAC
ncbi:SDR family oxidoreductase [Paucibacter sp. PLA-PC-4]|uniref:SDR family oxidoreductase n=1 Tax=Paucibacter sp. PLA-PC-4 TaxID=2993655 RepID=UPI00224B222D|nr:SDR family oxidoreductase [Paucibacter sp. PLA-PC-4]MCX2863545.1 SDR family oxidoreductase [Paucibacter sp. PLA-PC-4]